MIKWIKQGRIFHLEPSLHRTTHCQVPTPWVSDMFIRIYYACRKDGKSFPAFFDLDRGDLKTILRSEENPVMGWGDPGMFDSDGIMPSCVIENNGELWLYYIGWNELTKTARYHNEIGLAVSKDGGETFESMFKGPVVGRSSCEPGLAVMPFVTCEDGDWHMLYQSLIKWEKIGDQYEPVYVIKYAMSADGVNWDRLRRQCIASNYPLEAFSRPSVIYDGKSDIYRCWFCYRGSEDYRGGGEGAYRIGYAESAVGISFDRMDEKAGIDIGAAGEFDCEMICYPYVIEVDGRILMFYNGNGFGETGIGLAIGDYT